MEEERRKFGKIAVLTNIDEGMARMSICCIRRGRKWRPPSMPFPILVLHAMS
jgi:hypothetical protein